MEKRLKHGRKTPDGAVRRASLGKMGFSTYRQYLASPLWQKIRASVLERQEGVCALCPRGATQVHHHNYTLPVMKGKEPKLLIGLCASCHLGIEFRPDGTKRDPFEVRSRCRELQSGKGGSVAPGGPPT